MSYMNRTYADSIEIEEGLPSRSRHEGKCEEALGELFGSDKDVDWVGCSDLFELFHF